MRNLVLVRVLVVVLLLFLPCFLCLWWFEKAKSLKGPLGK